MARTDADVWAWAEAAAAGRDPVLCRRLAWPESYPVRVPRCTWTLTGLRSVPTARLPSPSLPAPFPGSPVRASPWRTRGGHHACAKSPYRLRSEQEFISFSRQKPTGPTYPTGFSACLKAVGSLWVGEFVRVEAFLWRPSQSNLDPRLTYVAENVTQIQTAAGKHGGKMAAGRCVSGYLSFQWSDFEFICSRYTLL